MHFCTTVLCSIDTNALLINASYCLHVTSMHILRMHACLALLGVCHPCTSLSVFCTTVLCSIDINASYCLHVTSMHVLRTHAIHSTYSLFHMYALLYWVFVIHTHPCPFLHKCALLYLYQRIIDINASYCLHVTSNACNSFSCTYFASLAQCLLLTQLVFFPVVS